MNKFPSSRKSGEPSSGCRLAELDDADQKSPSALPRQLPLSRITVMPQQIRAHRDDDSYHELVRSVREQGILQPLLVRPVGEGFGLVCGHRRFAAAQHLELPAVPVLIRSIPDDEVCLVGLHENIHRKEMNPVDEAEAYRVLLANGVVKNQLDLARRLGISDARVSRTLGLLKLPQEVLALFLPRGKGAGSPLTERHARILRKLDHAGEQIELARRAVEEELSVERLQELVAGGMASATRSQRARRDVARRKSWTNLAKSKYRLGTKGFIVVVPTRDVTRFRSALKELWTCLGKEPEGEGKSRE